MASKTRENVVAGGPASGSAIASPAVPIANGGDTVVIDDFDVELMDRAEFGIRNTGAVAMVVKVWYRYVDGGQWYQDLTSGLAPSVSNGASARISLPNLTARRLRVTANGTGATTTAIIELHASGYQ